MTDAATFATHRHRHKHHLDYLVEVVQETADRVVYRTAKLYARSRDSFELDFEPIPPAADAEEPAR